jgi:hypothetical protein
MLNSSIALASMMSVSKRQPFGTSKVTVMHSLQFVALLISLFSIIRTLRCTGMGMNG